MLTPPSFLKSERTSPAIFLKSERASPSTLLPSEGGGADMPDQEQAMSFSSANAPPPSIMFNRKLCMFMIIEDAHQYSCIHLSWHPVHVLCTAQGLETVGRFHLSTAPIPRYGSSRHETKYRPGCRNQSAMTETHAIVGTNYEKGKEITHSPTHWHQLCDTNCIPSWNDKMCLYNTICIDNVHICMKHACILQLYTAKVSMSNNSECFNSVLHGKLCELQRWGASWLLL